MRAFARFRPSPALVIAMIALIAATTGTAIAARGGTSVTRVENASPPNDSSGPTYNSNDHKTATVKCPPGQLLIDGGATVETTGSDPNPTNNAAPPDDEVAALTSVNPESDGTPPNQPNTQKAEAQEDADYSPAGSATLGTTTPQWRLVVEGFCKD